MDLMGPFEEWESRQCNSLVNWQVTNRFYILVFLSFLFVLVFISEYENNSLHYMYMMFCASCFAGNIDSIFVSPRATRVLPFKNVITYIAWALDKTLLLLY